MTTSKYRIVRIAKQRPDQQSSYAKVTWKVIRCEDSYEIAECDKRRDAQAVIRAEEQLQAQHANSRSLEV